MVSVAEQEDYKGIKEAMKGLGFDVRDVLGDDNCGLYAMLLGLANIGKVPNTVLWEINVVLLINPKK